MAPTTPTDIADLVLLTARAADAYGRADLGARARHTDLDEETCRILVAGEFKQGKSSLVNGIVGAAVCPVDDDVATAVPTVVTYGTAVEVDAVFGASLGDDDSGDTVRRRLPTSALASVVLEGDGGRSLVEPPPSGFELVGVEVRLPRHFLRTGIQLIDSPGLGGLTSRHGAVTAGLLSQADAVLFVTDARQELTAAEAEFLKRAARRCPATVVAMTKTDIHPSWREIIEIDRHHVGQIAPDVPVLPVSSTLRELAVGASSQELSVESGFPALVAWLEEASERRREDAEHRVRDDMVDIIEQLRTALRSELAALVDEAGADRLVAQLEAARASTQALQQGSAAWQVVLADGMGDLASDVDHDLREHLRNIGVEAQARVEASDPTRRWEEHERWLQAAASTALVNNHDLLIDRAESLAERIGELFREASGAENAALAPDAYGVPADVRRPKVERGGVRTLLGGMRGGYGGILMFGALASIAGMALTAPVMITIGVIMGGKGVKDERGRELVARRQRALASMRSYLDEVGFRAGKHSRDTLRQIQRELRDHYRDQAATLQKTASESLAAAQRAVQVEGPDRDRRRADLEAELQRLDTLSSWWEAL